MAMKRNMLNLNNDFDLNSKNNFDDCTEVLNIKNLEQISRYMTDGEICNFLKSFTCKPNDSFSLMHVNCRNLSKHFNDLENLMSVINNPITCIALTETWLTSVSETNFNLTGYKMLSQPRIGKHGGGVGFYLRVDVDYKVKLKYCRNVLYFKCMFVELLESGRSSTLIGCVHRSPNTDPMMFNNELSTLLEEIGKSKHSLIVILTHSLTETHIRQEDDAISTAPDQQPGPRQHEGLDRHLLSTA